MKLEKDENKGEARVFLPGRVEGAAVRAVRDYEPSELNESQDVPLPNSFTSQQGPGSRQPLCFLFPGTINLHQLTSSSRMKIRKLPEQRHLLSSQCLPEIM